VTQETVFSHAKTQSNAKSFLLTTRGHTIKHDIPYYCTFHTMATRSFARWPTEFKHDLKTENGNRKSENLFIFAKRLTLSVNQIVSRFRSVLCETTTQSQLEDRK